MHTCRLGSFLLSSTDPDRLRGWYQAAFRTRPDRNGVLDLGGVGLLVDGRTDLADRNGEPGRIMSTSLPTTPARSPRTSIGSGCPGSPSWRSGRTGCSPRWPTRTATTSRSCSSTAPTGPEPRRPSRPPAPTAVSLWTTCAAPGASMARPSAWRWPRSREPGRTGNSRVPLHLDDRQLRGAAPGLRAPATPTTGRTPISTKRLAAIRPNRNRPCSTPRPTACAR